MFSRFFLPSKTLMLFLEVYLCWKPVSLGQSRLYQRAHLGIQYMVAHHIVVQHKLNHRRWGELPSGAHSFNSRPSWSCEQELVSRNQLFKRRITLSTCKRTYSTAAELYVLLPPGKSLHCPWVIVVLLPQKRAILKHFEFAHYCSIIGEVEWFQIQREFVTPFEEISPQYLNKCLQKFYLSARKRKKT